MVGDGDVENPIHQDRRALDHRNRSATLRAYVGNLVHPLRGKLIHIGCVDLCQRAEALAGVVAIEGGPRCNGRRTERLRIEIDVRGGESRNSEAGQNDRAAKRVSEFHYSVSRKAVTLCMSSFLSVMIMA